MRLLELDELTRILFEDFDPFMLMYRGDVAGGFSLGAFLRDEESGYDEPAALIVCYIKNRNLIIQWMFVVEEHRMKGIGDEVLDALILYAKRKNCEKISAYFLEDALREEICYRDMDYFYDHGYKEKTELFGEWIFDVKTLLSQAYFDKENYKYTPVCLSEVDEERIKKYVENLDADPDTAKIGILKYGETKFDRDISFVVTDEEDNLLGALLQINEDVVYPLYYMAKDEDVSKNLITYAARRAGSKYGKNLLINVVLTDDKYLGLVEDIFPGKKKNNYILSAYVEKLEENRRRGIEYADPYPEMGEIVEESIRKSPDVYGMLCEGKEEVLTLTQLSKALTQTKIPENLTLASMNTMNLRDMQKILINCRYYDYNGAFDSLPEKFTPDMLDGDLSCYVVGKEKISAAFFIHVTDEGVIIPLLMYLEKKESKQLLFAMMLYAYKMAVQKYKAETKVIIRCQHEDISEIVEKIVDICNK